MKVLRAYKKSGGFTLAEVLVVLVILGIAATVVIPSLIDTSGMQVTSAARALTSTMLFAQTAAISSQQQFQVVFDVDGESYEVQNDLGVVVADPVTGGKDFRVSYTEDNRLHKVQLETVDFDGTNILWFDRMGVPYGGAITGSPVALTSGSVTLSAGDETITINVEPITGRIKIE